MEAHRLVCSCCLVNSPHKSLKTPYIYFGTTEVFLDVLEDCFQIQLTLDNEDGGGICEECVGRLRDASDFKRQVQRCQAKMQARRARRETIVLVKDEEPFLEMADDIGTCDELVSNEEPLLEMADDSGTCDEPLSNEEPLLEMADDSGTCDEPLSNEEPLLEMADDIGTCDEPVSNEETPAPSEAPVDDATTEDGVISSLNPNNIKLKIEGSIPFPRSDRESVEHTVYSSAENNHKDWNSTAKIDRAGPITVKETEKALDNVVSTAKKSLKFWPWDDSTTLSNEVKDADQTLEKEASIESNSNENVNDTENLSNVIAVSVNETEEAEEKKIEVKETEEVLDKEAKKEHKKAKKKAKHIRVGPDSVNETGKARDNELFGRNNSHEHLRESKLGITRVSNKKRQHKVQDDKRIRMFTEHVFQQTMKAFEDMRDRSDSLTRQHIATLIKSYKAKFTDFVLRTRQTMIKTRQGARNVLLHILETSNLMMDRIVNFLKENMIATDELGPGGLRGAAVRLDQEVDAVKQLEYEHACKSFGVCRNSNGFRVALLDLISILLKLPAPMLIQFNDAATEALKYMDLSKITKTEETHRIIKKWIKKQERVTAAMLKFSLTILYGTLSMFHLPLIVNKAVHFEEPAVRQTVAFQGFIDALEEALPPNEPNRREWATTKDRLKRWADGQPLDVQEIIQGFFDNMMRGVAKSKRIKGIIADLVKDEE